MIITETKIPAVRLIEPHVFGDERGFFMETWNDKTFRDLGINAAFMQDNHSRSVKHTLRGLHYQIRQPQGKLVRVTRGEIFDVAVDLRIDSPTFGEWVGEYLCEEKKRMLWVPPGFAHGFLVTSKTADVQYKCTRLYAPEYERSILWSDSRIGIDWRLQSGEGVLLSEKDRKGLDFDAAEQELRQLYQSHDK